MFRRKLKALDYHSADNADVKNPLDLKALVVWLEDQKIRHYKIEERGDLRDSNDDNWTAAFKKYLADLECPYDTATNFSAALDWLLGVAIRYDYGEAAEQTPHLRSGLVPPDVTPSKPPSSATPSDTSSSKSALDIDPSNETFIAGVQALARILQISKHPDPAVLLEAVRIVIEEKLSPPVLAAAKSMKPGDARKKQFKITPKECGFDLGDPVLGEAAKALRLLHIQELRHLQTNINELIVAVQSITANPKTDQSLGKIGR